MITTWVHSMDATTNMTDDLKKMSVDDANVQTTHKENAVCRINRAAFESGIDPMDPVTHATGCLMNISNGQIAQPNVNVDRALEVGRGQLKQFDSQTAILMYVSAVLWPVV